MSEMGRSLIVGLVAHNVVRGDGQGRVAMELARTMTGRGHRVEVWAQRVDPDLRPVVRFHRLPRPPLPQLLLDVLIFAAGLRIRRRVYDVVVVMGPVTLPRLPFAYYAEFSQHGWYKTWSPAARPGLYHRAHASLGRWLEGRVAPKASLVIACSDQVKRDLKDVVAGQPVDFAVVPNGIDISEFKPPAQQHKAAARRRFGIGESAFVIGFVGEYLTSRKGLDLVLGAVRADEHVVIAGAGRLGRLDGMNVHELGVVPASEVFEIADTVVVPSRYEPFSLVALEAAASGVPVILSPEVGAGAYLDGAVVLRHNDAESIRAALDELQQNPRSAEAAARRGRAAVENLDWASTTAQAVDVLEAFANRGNK